MLIGSIVVGVAAVVICISAVMVFLRPPMPKMPGSVPNGGRNATRLGALWGGDGHAL